MRGEFIQLVSQIWSSSGQSTLSSLSPFFSPAKLMSCFLDLVKTHVPQKLISSLSSPSKISLTLPSFILISYPSPPTPPSSSLFPACLPAAARGAGCECFGAVHPTHNNKCCSMREPEHYTKLNSINLHYISVRHNPQQQLLLDERARTLQLAESY